MIQSTKSCKTKIDKRIRCNFTFNFEYRDDFTTKATMGRDITVNWLNWPINQLGGN